MRFLVWTDGRVRDCRIDRSSGNRLLDNHLPPDSPALPLRSLARRAGAAGAGVDTRSRSWVIEPAGEER
ncbi:energy transducer TonB [Sphingomonas sp. MMS24-JH45]